MRSENRAILSLSAAKYDGLERMKAAFAAGMI